MKISTRSAVLGQLLCYKELVRLVPEYVIFFPKSSDSLSGYV